MSRMERLLRMVENAPEDADLRYMLAQERAGAGDHAGAVEAYDECLAIDGAYLYAYFHKASSQQSLGDLPGARATLEEGLGRAQAAQDEKAASEISAFLEGLAD